MSLIGWTYQSNGRFITRSMPAYSCLTKRCLSMGKTSNTHYRRSSMEKQHYEVRAILGSKRVGRNKALKYLLAWEGYADADNSWEFADAIKAPKLIQEFHQKNPTAIKVIRVEKEYLSMSDSSAPPASYTSPIPRTIYDPYEDHTDPPSTTTSASTPSSVHDQAQATSTLAPSKRSSKTWQPSQCDQCHHRWRREAIMLCPLHKMCLKKNRQDRAEAILRKARKEASCQSLAFRRCQESHWKNYRMI
jgi:hypothetical protein